MSIFPIHQENDAVRWFAGISVSSDCRRIESAVIGVHGQGSGAPVEIRKTISFDVPPEITVSYNELHLSLKKTNGNIPASLLRHTVNELVSVEKEAVDELLESARIPHNDILAVGIHDAGIRCETPEGLFFHGLCDASYLAEQTGLNIVDAFPLQDIAAHGRGGPIFPMPSWIFLKSDISDRILLDLGRTARLTFLPKAENPFSHQQIQYQDIVPCGSLLDALTFAVSEGKLMMDLGGKLTVQGCRCDDLLDNFRLAADSLDDWNPDGLSPDCYLSIAKKQASSSCSYQDILTTASCFIAERISENVLGMVEEHSDGKSEPEIIVKGGCRLHGMLMNLIMSKLERRNLFSITDLGIPSETFDALCCAMLTVMAADCIPATLPHLTRSDTSVTLGRLTAGSVAHWQRLIQEMSQIKPAARPLRRAV
jgi:1,6-anhydro-N-acetylmuramate kinase